MLYLRKFIKCIVMPNKFIYSISKPSDPNWIPSEEENKKINADVNKEFAIFQLEEFKNNFNKKLELLKSMLTRSSEERKKLKELKEEEQNNPKWLLPGSAGYSPYYPRRIKNGGVIKKDNG